MNRNSALLLITMTLLLQVVAAWGMDVDELAFRISRISSGLVLVRSPAGTGVETQTRTRTTQSRAELARDC